MTIIQRISTRTTSQLARTRGITWIQSFLRSYSKKIIQENDIVLLRNKNNLKVQPVLSKPLVPGMKVLVPGYRDEIHTDDIIGRGVRDLVSSKKKGFEFRIHDPTLADYTSLSRRLVTPIYPQDANLIVSLLDLHPVTPGPDIADQEEEPLEIFEAGTGHGALTLHLARAIHGANSPAPDHNLPHLLFRDDEGLDQLLDKRISSSQQSDIETATGHSSDADVVAQERENVRAELVRENDQIKEVRKQRMPGIKTWRRKRRAMIHTLDISPEHSKYAQKIIRNFRHGMYYPHIDFHIGSINEYLTSRLSQSAQEPFLEHAILDLPGTHEYLESVGKALRPNGSLITWNPSISQVMKCVEVVRDLRLPFVLEKVLELGSSVGVGGREWDIRSVRPRALQRLRETKDKGSVLTEEGDIGETGTEEPIVADAEGPSRSEKSSLKDNTGYEMVCRPKVGIRTEGGGFVGLWRRMEMY